MISKPSLRATLLAMKPDQVEYIPFGIWAQNSIRNNACMTGVDYGRKYKVEIDREAKHYKITRIS
jgi:formylmethanofuran dehydrogenase subunit D